MLRVYVAGPVGVTTPECDANCRKAEDVAAKLCRAGYQPFVAHANVQWMLRHNFTEAEALAWDMRWLDACDALVRLPGVSPGSDAEVARARFRGMPIVHLDGSGANDGPIERMIRRALEA